jgi:hypothetical protein
MRQPHEVHPAYQASYDVSDVELRHSARSGFRSHGFRKEIEK